MKNIQNLIAKADLALDSFWLGFVAANGHAALSKWYQFRAFMRGSNLPSKEAQEKTVLIKHKAQRHALECQILKGTYA